jgi:hypothetical protein
MAGERTNGHVRWTKPGSRELTASGDPGGEAVPGALVTGRADAAPTTGAEEFLGTSLFLGRPLYVVAEHPFDRVGM